MYTFPFLKKRFCEVCSVILSALYTECKAGTGKEHPYVFAMFFVNDWVDKKSMLCYYPVIIEDHPKDDDEDG
ncbi:MAG: hypothetical protein IJ354_08925 [Clostridia bacterium]|nr:hypothetical protein [Clostridia bacterium]